MEKSHIIGIDVSKLTLDAHCHSTDQFITVSNNTKGHKSLFKWIRQTAKDINTAMVVMEHTGIYTYGLEQFLAISQISYVKRPALDIKRSIGMKRGKTDKADAKMISLYGWYRRSELQPMQPLSDAQHQLQQLMHYRDKLVADRASYESRIKELRTQLGDKLPARITESSEYMMQVLTIEIKALEASIETLIQEAPQLHKNYELVKSVQGIGFVTAVHLLIVTENFTKFATPRKFACYSGIAPFEHSSGTSIRGKTKVSHLANKKIKSLLTLAAICAVKHDPQLKAKYQQKIAEGQPKMKALNIIRFKLIERVFAVIKRQSPYILSMAA